jgi:histidine kinase
VHDAQADERFNPDPYIRANRVRSVLCLPLLNQGSLVGSVYLENNLLGGAFKPGRVALLKTLSAQIAVSLVNAGLYRDMETQVRSRTREIESERKKSEDLLMNILPESVARELKQEGRAKPRKYEEVTVLFTDFVGFTQVAEQLDAEQLVAEIDYCFREFDRIVSRNGLEKIKTIGDAYMCAAGLPIPEENSAARAVQAALDILQFMEELKKNRAAEGRQCFEIRIGLHSGPVVAGVVGTKKFTYDIWGDTVNTASRMESSGQPGGINISGATYHLVKDLYRCEYRGRIQAKNKGEVDMYWVLGRNVPAG